MPYRERLKQILCQKSVKCGEFILSSGKKSNYYLDARLTTLDAEGAYCAGMVILELLQALSPRPKAIGGLTLGADPIVAVAAALSHQQSGPPIAGFLVRKEPKKHGTQQFIEGYRGQPGDPVVIVDDVCTTGGSTIKAIEQAKAAGFDVIAAICLVDREESGRQEIEKLCPFHSVFTARELLAALEAKPAQTTS
ncbi:MAG: orotate phosphoribosyltransferase [Acidobacteria bacterium]|nr:orotate phosphoribosyltransferase [Acidobacteriota bacterium]